jgi:methyltransferase (TIGR00027 family)
MWTEGARVPNRAARTATGTMAIVVTERAVPGEQRLVDDDLAVRFQPALAKAILAFARWDAGRRLLIRSADRAAPGQWASILCRKRYAYDRARDAIENGCDAVVILGAGLDTLGYRVQRLRNVPVFEVDLPENIEHKKVKLRKAFGGIPDYVHLVPVDFDNDDLATSLATAGYRYDQKTFFLWEGVIPYLTEAGVRSTFGSLRNAASGSRLVFTYVLREFIDGTNLHDWQTVYKRFVVQNNLFHFGWMPDEVPAFLEEYGWHQLEQMGSAEFTERYVRPAGRDLRVSDLERSVHAEKR